MKKRIWMIVTAMVCSLMLAACTETTMDNGNDTNGMQGEPATTQNNQGDRMENGMDSAVNGVGNAVKDAADGVGNAAKDVIDGTTNAIDSATDGMSGAVNNATGN